MKDYVFNKPRPFGDAFKGDLLGKGFAKAFGGDQRNVVWFAFGLGIPGIIVSFIGLAMTSWGHPWLMAFNALLLVFVAWVVWAMIDIYRRTNRLVAEKPKTIYCFDFLEEMVKEWHVPVTGATLGALPSRLVIVPGEPVVDYYGKQVGSVEIYFQERADFLEYLEAKYYNIIPADDHR